MFAEYDDPKMIKSIQAFDAIDSFFGQIDIRAAL